MSYDHDYLRDARCCFRLSLILPEGGFSLAGGRLSAEADAVNDCLND